MNELTSKSVQRTSGMQVRWQPRSDVDKFTNTLDPGSLMEVACCNRFPIQRIKGGLEWN